MTDFADHLQDALGANYQLDRELTGGGMSRVFVAIDRSLGRKVVVKVLPPELAAGVNRERFRREIQVAAQLQHPHIVPLLSAGEQGDLLWYTMPYIDGESLRAALERKRQFTPREVIRMRHNALGGARVFPGPMQVRQLPWFVRITKRAFYPAAAPPFLSFPGGVSGDARAVSHLSRAFERKWLQSTIFHGSIKLADFTDFRRPEWNLLENL